MINSNMILVFNVADKGQVAVLQSDVQAVYKDKEGKVQLRTKWESPEGNLHYELRHTFADAILIWTGNEPKETVVV